MAFKILIAEDEDITLKHLVHALEREGYTAVGVQNGTDALKNLACLATVEVFLCVGAADEAIAALAALQLIHILGWVSEWRSIHGKF